MTMSIRQTSRVMNNDHGLRVAGPEVCYQSEGAYPSNFSLKIKGFSCGASEIDRLSIVRFEILAQVLGHALANALVDYNHFVGY